MNYSPEPNVSDSAARIEAEGFLNLWSSVLRLTIEDIQSGLAKGWTVNTPSKSGDRRNFLSAWHWLHNDSKRPGNFWWACEILDLDPSRVRAAIYLNKTRVNMQNILTIPFEDCIPTKPFKKRDLESVIPKSKIAWAVKVWRKKGLVDIVGKEDRETVYGRPTQESGAATRRSSRRNATS